jgi:hypothetical protein
LNCRQQNKIELLDNWMNMEIFSWTESIFSAN